jgi:hypothetical protein
MMMSLAQYWFLAKENCKTSTVSLFPMHETYIFTSNARSGILIITSALKYFLTGG